MAASMTKAGRLAILKHTLGVEPLGVLTMRLFRNPLPVPAGDVTLRDLQENDEEGYRPHEIDPTKWEVRVDERGITMAVYERVIFDFVSAVERCHGYYVTDQQDTILWVELFMQNGSYQLPSHGGIIGVRTRLLLA